MASKAYLLLGLNPFNRNLSNIVMFFARDNFGPNYIKDKTFKVGFSLV